MSPRLKTCDYTPQGHHSRRTWARGATDAYDHRGRMLSKEILPTSTNSTFSTLHSTFEYLWDGWNIIRETTTNLSTFQPFNFSTDYVWGLDIDGTMQGTGGVGGLLAVIRSNSSTLNSSTHKLFLPAYDANGNVTEYVATNGVVVAHYEYSAFGEPTVSSGELASAFTHQFSTKPYCATTGFSEYVYRKYRSAIGMWISRDPIGERQISTVYCFSRNSPIGHIDYLGLKVTNNGPCAVVIKPEDDHDPPVLLPPKSVFDGKQDGVYPCCNVGCVVFKTANNIDVEFTPSGDFSTTGGNFKERLGQMCKGGCKNDDFLDKWPNWPSLQEVQKLCNENLDK